MHYDDYDIIGLLNPSDLGQHPLRYSRGLSCILPDHRAVPNEHSLYPFEIGDIQHILIKKAATRAFLKARRVSSNPACK